MINTHHSEPLILSPISTIISTNITPTHNRVRSLPCSTNIINNKQRSFYKNNKNNNNNNKNNKNNKNNNIHRHPTIPPSPQRPTNQ